MNRMPWARWFWAQAVIVAAVPVALWGHDERTMTRAEGERVSTELVHQLAASTALAEAPRGMGSPGELKRKLQRLPEVRELIHLRELSVPVVIAHLETLRPKTSAADGRLAAALVVVLELSDARGAVPSLCRVIESSQSDHPFLPDLATQAIKAMSRQPDQDLREVRFSLAARQRAVAEAKVFATERARGLITTLDGAASLVLGADASGVASLREILAAHPTVVELSFLSELICDELERQFKVPAPEMPAQDVELAIFAYAVEKGRCAGALPALRELAEATWRVEGEMPFTPHFATHALAVGYDMPESMRKEVYSKAEQSEVVRRAAVMESHGNASARPFSH